MTLSTIDETTIDERKFVVALARGLDLLRAFRPGETMLGNRDFAERTAAEGDGEPARLHADRARLPALRRDARKVCARRRRAVARLRAAVGPGTIDLARPHMQALARDIGAAVSLGCRDRADMIYLETIRSETALTLGPAPGSRLSMLTVSMGRAYLTAAGRRAPRALCGAASCGRRRGRRRCARRRRAAGGGRILGGAAAIRSGRGTWTSTRRPSRFASRARGAG